MEMKMNLYCRFCWIDLQIPKAINIISLYLEIGAVYIEEAPKGHEVRCKRELYIQEASYFWRT